MFGKKTNTPQVEAAVVKAANFEITIADMARRSERRAWMVAWSAVVMALILAGGYFVFLPLKEKVPYLVMADAYTGTSTVAKLTGNFGENGITTSEALNKSNIAHFIMARESYDYSQFGQRDWNTVHAMATPMVTSGYARLFTKTNPENPQTLFGKNKSIRVKILSLQLHDPAEVGGTPNSATVRFQRSLYDKGAGASTPLDSKIASLEFSYNPNLKMDEPNRILNPLGFQVTSYRVDNDYAALPPLESEFPEQVVHPASPAGMPASEALPAVPAGATEAVPGAPAAVQPAPTQPSASTMPSAANGVGTP
jgi:type IV secretion system protein VirB8